MNLKKQIPLFLLIGTIGLLSGVLVVTFAYPDSVMRMHHRLMSVDDHVHEFTEHRLAIQDDMREHGDYRCCLEKPCTYCIEKTPGHGEAAACHCLDDIVNGRHPCGECIGEILEGHGSPYLTEYFAPAIAEEVGEEHLETLRLIIAAQYSVDEADLH